MGEKNEIYEQKLQRFLGTAKGNRYDKSAVIYDLIMDTEDPETAWRFFCENAYSIDSSEESEIEVFFTAQQIQKYEKEYFNIIDALLNKLVLRHCSEDDFYKELWNTIFVSDLLFEDKYTKIYALAQLYADPRVPYFYLSPGIKMSNEEFINIINKNRELLQKVTFVLNCKYAQKTETASLLVEVLKSCESDKDKAVVMSKILDVAENKILFNIFKDRE